MVNGIEKFKEYFAAFPDNYVIIGGTACDLITEEAGLVARATKDIDIILVVEALSSDFVKTFWQFIKDGNYTRTESGGEDRKYYRFIDPQNKLYPKQIELFSRTPDLIELDPDFHLTPIPVDDDLSSLSAILLDDDFYKYVTEHSELVEEIHRAKIESIIVLKAKAFIDISNRIAQGIKEDNKHLKKHRNDAFKMTLLLTGEERFPLPESIRIMLIDFLKQIKDDLPTPDIFAAMGIKGADANQVLATILNVFEIKEEEI
ncbi:MULTISPECIES: hypothetical protein [Sphingobacterium]|uniref:hypothetical protein n=1 Tax=Sphingobacterium TaxID=28453 RepID=UPI0028A5B029|nr:hypothetical protein [Sphingobacterium multivorum]